MGFQPFGYSFETITSLPLAKAKATIRSKKTGIFDAKNGARGWILGPFICLWFNAFDRFGPMLFGVISANGSGTRVHGRAGSDLNGVLLFTLLIPLTAWLVFKMVSEGQATDRQLFVIAVVFLVGGPLIFWSAHKDRKNAEPLVWFLRKALEQPDAPSKSTLSSRKNLNGMRLILNGETFEGPVTEAEIQSTLLRVGDQDFMIIESTEQDYLQTFNCDGTYILEMRKGGPDEHYQVVRSKEDARDLEKADDTFTLVEVNAAMVSYLSGGPLPSSMRLQHIAANG